MPLPHSTKNAQQNHLQLRDVRRFEIKSLHVHDGHALYKKVQDKRLSVNTNAQQDTKNSYKSDVSF